MTVVSGWGRAHRQLNEAIAHPAADYQWQKRCLTHPFSQSKGEVHTKLTILKLYQCHFKTVCCYFGGEFLAFTIKKIK